MTSRDVADTLSKVDVGTLATWRAAGISTRQLHPLVSSGQLVKVRHGAYAASSVLARAASDPGLRHALEVAATMATRSHGGTATKRYGVPVTTAARAVADIARTTAFMEGVVVADAALYERHASKSELRRVLAGCERWPGTSQARQVIDFADGLAESVLESCARVLFRDHGLPPPELQVHITGRDRTMIARVDFFWRRYGVVAETDGLLKYDSGERAIAERRRDRLLLEAGFEVVHVTWQELFSDPARVAGRIREAFRRAERLGLAR